MRVVAFVPIRLNSKRVIGKNLKLLGGKPLLKHVLETLVKISSIDNIYVYCSSEEIKQYLPEKVKFLKRDTRLDQDETLGSEIYDSFIQEIDSTIYVLVHTTSPFIKAETIEESISQVLYNGFDSAFSAEKIQTFCWYKGVPLNYKLDNIPRTQTIEPIYIETSAFYIFKKELWQKYKRRIGFKPYISILNKIEGVDIDTNQDFEFASLIFDLKKYGSL
jgi:CMP-N-acetylneuraminic acid synthetase